MVEDTIMAQEVGGVSNTKPQDIEQGEPQTVADSIPPNPLKRDADTAELRPTRMSKSQMKKLKKKQEWEDARELRKVKRKEKMQEKRARRRKDYEEKHAYGGADIQEQEKKPHVRATQLPITFIFDCSFDDLMNDNERVSLGSQLTRSYSDNKKSRFRAHLALSSFGGKLKERFEGLLERQYLKWHGVRFLEEDFVKTAELAKRWMKEEGGGLLAGALARAKESNVDAIEQELDQVPDEQVPEAKEQEGEVVYLSSDSPDTLTELKPNSTYIIGALVDKNRHKGICYKRAVEAGIKTAKLPIGDYLDMSSRKVLTTNHVNEIMLKWLEVGDWGEAFIQVIPKRKGGALKGQKDSEGGEQLERAEDGEQDGEVQGEIQGEDQDEDVQAEEQDEELHAEEEGKDSTLVTKEP